MLRCRWEPEEVEGAESCSLTLVSLQQDQRSLLAMFVALRCPIDLLEKVLDGLEKECVHQLCVELGQSRLPVVVKDEHGANHGDWWLLYDSSSRSGRKLLFGAFRPGMDFHRRPVDSVRQ